MFKRKRKSHACIELNDYIMRILVSKGPGLVVPKVIEIPLAAGVVEDGEIMDDMALYHLLKEQVELIGGKRQNIRFFVSDTSILLKAFEHPEDVETKDLLSYVQMEIGNSIHLPFAEPLVDVYDPVEQDGKAMLFATPPDEVQKMLNLLVDHHLQPQVADIRALANMRVLDELQVMTTQKTYLLIDWAINECSITILSDGEIEFLRYQPIATELTQWKYERLENDEIAFYYEGDFSDYKMSITDLTLEIERLMNFFKFSLHKGEKAVDEIVMLGDNPYLDIIHEFFAENLDVAISSITDDMIAKKYEGFKVKHMSLIGLAIKEVE